MNRKKWDRKKKRQKKSIKKKYIKQSPTEGSWISVKVTVFGTHYTSHLQLSQPEGKEAGVFIPLRLADQPSVVKDCALGFINYQELLALSVQAKQFCGLRGVSRWHRYRWTGVKPYQEAMCTQIVKGADRTWAEHRIVFPFQLFKMRP